MESDNELRDKITVFLEEILVDRKIALAADSGEILLLVAKWESGGEGDIVEVIKDIQSAAHHKGYHDGLMKMAQDIMNLISE